MPDAQLFCVALGPVQGFIEGARRMRDLQMGSRILSDVALALAERLSRQHQAQMVFPSISPDVPPDPSPGDTTNKLLCVLPSSTVPEDVAKDLKAHLATLLSELGDDCMAALTTLKVEQAIDHREFRHQLHDVLQLYCAWARRGPQGVTQAPAYATAYELVNQALEARKLTREFAPNENAPDGVQLSSLDGLRESVLADARVGADASNQEQAARLRDRLGLSPGEHLDAIGLIKRTLGRSAAFPAVSRVALQPWVAAMEKAPLAELHECLDKLVGVDLARRNGCHAEDPMATLPFDCEVLLPGRAGILAEQLAHDRPDRDQAMAALQGLEALTSRKDEHGHFVLDLPRGDTPHVALLMADGDHMGVLLGRLAQEHGLEGHSRMAKALQATAALAYKVVREHGGCPLYAGGDDVMAVLPVQAAVACALALQSQLTDLLNQAMPADFTPRATLSIGLAISHVLTPMGQLRHMAHRALRIAKYGPPEFRTAQGLRDAMCVWVEPRGGVGRACVGAWGTSGDGLAARMARWQRAFQGGEASRSLPYDLISEVTGEEAWAIPQAVHRVLTRRLQCADDVAQTLAQDAKNVLSFWKPHAPTAEAEQWACERLADELYVARWLQAHPKPQTNLGQRAPQGASHA